MLVNLDIFEPSDSVLQHLIGDFFNTGWSDISALFRRAISAHIFSGKSEREFEDMQDMLFLYTYLLLMNLERKDMFEINGVVPEISEFYLSFDFDTVRQYYAERHIEVKLLFPDFI